MDITSTPWRTSTYSGDNGGACVEVRATWRTSTHSGYCVQVRTSPPAVAVRDSKDPTGPQLAFPSTTWTAFTTRLRSST